MFYTRLHHKVSLDMPDQDLSEMEIKTIVTTEVLGF